MLLAAAKDSVADYVDGIDRRRMVVADVPLQHEPLPKMTDAELEEWRKPGASLARARVALAEILQAAADDHTPVNGRCLLSEDLTTLAAELRTQPVFAPLFRRTGAKIEIELGEHTAPELFERLDLALRHVLALALECTPAATAEPVVIGHRAPGLVDDDRRRSWSGSRRLGNLGELGRLHDGGGETWTQPACVRCRHVALAHPAGSPAWACSECETCTGYLGGTLEEAIDWLAGLTDDPIFATRERTFAAATAEHIETLRKEAADALEAKARIERAFDVTGNGAVPIERARAWLMSVVNFAGSTQEAVENALALLVWLYYAEPVMPDDFFSAPPRAEFGDRGARTIFNGPSIEQAIAWMKRIEAFTGNSDQTRALAKWIRERFETAIEATKVMLLAVAPAATAARVGFQETAAEVLDAMRGADWLAGHPQYDAEAAAIQAVAEKEARDIYGRLPFYMTNDANSHMLVDAITIKIAELMRTIARLRREYRELEQAGGVMRIDRATRTIGSNVHGIGPDTDGGPNPDYQAAEMTPRPDAWLANRDDLTKGDA